MKKRILVVDDSPSVRQMICFTLPSAGFDIDEAGDGKQALNKAQSGAYQMVFTDQNMPVMDGLTLIRSLRALPTYKSVPILMLTTEAGDDMKAQGRAAGATGWLVKPFDPQKLLDVVKKVLP
jgi:two-component system, chemotaxis family, chemotaxis protein CheY